MAKKKKSSPQNVVIGIIVLIALLVGAYFGVSYYKKDALASVNGEMIAKRDVEVQLAFYSDAAKEVTTKSEIMDQLITRKLLLQEAKKQGIDVTKEETQEFIEKELEELGMTYSVFLEELNETGISYNEALDSYRDQLILDKFIQQKTNVMEVSVTDEEVQEYYNKNKNLFVTPKLVRFSMITVADKELAKQIRDKAKKGEDFAKLAAQYGTSKEKERDGDYGYMSYEQIPPGLNQLIFNLEIGKIDPGLSSTPLGYHIVKVTDIINPETRTFEDVKGMIKKALELEEQKQNLDKYVDSLKESSKIEIYDEEYVSKISKEHLECLKKNIIDENSVVFYYSDERCPFCTSMRDIVVELEDQGLNFVKVKHTGPKLDDLQACFSDVVTGKVPQFICAKTKATIFGEMTEQELKDFALECYLG